MIDKTTETEIRTRFIDLIADIKMLAVTGNHEMARFLLDELNSFCRRMVRTHRPYAYFPTLVLPELEEAETFQMIRSMFK